MGVIRPELICRSWEHLSEEYYQYLLFYIDPGRYRDIGMLSLFEKLRLELRGICAGKGYPGLFFRIQCFSGQTCRLFSIRDSSWFSRGLLFL